MRPPRARPGRGRELQRGRGCLIGLKERGRRGPSLSLFLISHHGPIRSLKKKKLLNGVKYPLCPSLLGKKISLLPLFLNGLHNVDFTNIINY